MSIFGWITLAQSGRRRDSSSSGRHVTHRYSGLPIPLPPAFFPAIVALTLFTAAGWIIVLAGLTSSSGPGMWRNAVVFLVCAGVIVSACALAVIYSPAKSRLRAHRETSPWPDAGHLDVNGVVPRTDIPVGSVPRPSERLDGEYPANHLQGSRGRGRRLLITSERLVFIAAVGSRARGAKDWQIEFRDVLKADVAPRGYGVWDGSLRRRLRISGSSGLVEYFVVWRPKELDKAINDLMLKDAAAAFPEAE
jgi:hypothetical protein